MPLSCQLTQREGQSTSVSREKVWEATLNKGRRNVKAREWITGSGRVMTKWKEKKCAQQDSSIMAQF